MNLGKRVDNFDGKVLILQRNLKAIVIAYNHFLTAPQNYLGHYFRILYQRVN